MFQLSIEPSLIIKINFCLSALLTTLSMVLIYVLWGKKENLNKLSLFIQSGFLLYLLNGYLTRAVSTKNQLTQFLNHQIDIKFYNNFMEIHFIYFIVNFMVMLTIFYFILESEDVVIEDKSNFDITCPKNYFKFWLNLINRVVAKIFKKW